MSIRTQRDSFPVGQWFLQVHSEYREQRRKVSFYRGEEEVGRGCFEQNFIGRK